jgi:hypothetical protein
LHLDTFLPKCNRNLQFRPYKHNVIEQKRIYVIFLDISEILEMGVHESSVCDTGVYRFPNFHIFKQFPFQILYGLVEMGKR